MVRRSTLILQDASACGKDHLRARFRAPAELHFTAGQWGNLILPLKDGPERRALSFASAPGELPELELCLRRGPGLAGEVLMAAAPGDSFDLEGPFGAFQWTGPWNGPVLLAASSTGVVPLRSILRAHAGELFAAASTTLLHGLLPGEEAPYGEELGALASPPRRFAYEVLRAAPDPGEHHAEAWRPLVERALALLRATPGPECWRVLLAGHGAFVDPVRTSLRETLGLQRSQIRAEVFWPAAAD